MWTTYSKCSYNGSFRRDWWYLLRYYFQPPAPNLQSGWAAALSFVFPAFVAVLPQLIPNTENKSGWYLPLPERQGFQKETVYPNHMRGLPSFELFCVPRHKLYFGIHSSRLWSRGYFPTHWMNMRNDPNSNTKPPISVLTTSSCGLEVSSLINQCGYAIPICEKIRKGLQQMGATLITESHDNLFLKVTFTVTLQHTFHNREVIPNLSPGKGGRPVKGQQCWRLKSSF